jgi:hypothetical protein
MDLYYMKTIILKKRGGSAPSIANMLPSDMLIVNALDYRLLAIIE